MKITNALEQFELNVGLVINFQISLIIVLAMIAASGLVKPTKITDNVSGEFILPTISQLAKNQKEIPFLFSLFITVLFINYQGLVGNIYVSTTQGFLAITLSIIILISIVVKGLNAKGLKGFGNMFFNDTPMALFTFIFVIEVFSYSLRSLSLGVRLMANLLAGHVLLHTLISYFKVFIGNKMMLTAVGAVIGILAIVLLEQAVWAIQAFVLTLLTATYLNEIED